MYSVSCESSSWALLKRSSNVEWRTHVLFWKYCFVGLSSSNSSPPNAWELQSPWGYRTFKAWPIGFIAEGLEGGENQKYCVSKWIDKQGKTQATFTTHSKVPSRDRFYHKKLLQRRPTRWKSSARKDTPRHGQVDVHGSFVDEKVHQCAFCKQLRGRSSWSQAEVTCGGVSTEELSACLSDLWRRSESQLMRVTKTWHSKKKNPS